MCRRACQRPDAANANPPFTCLCPPGRDLTHTVVDRLPRASIIVRWPDNASGWPSRRRTFSTTYKRLWSRVLSRASRPTSPPIYVTDDWPDFVPVSDREARVIEAFFVDVLDELFSAVP